MTFHHDITTPALRIPASELRPAAPILRHVIHRRTTIPILSTLRVTAYPGKDTVRVTANDLDIEIRAEIPAITNAALDTCIPANILFTLAKDSGDDIDLTRDGETLHIATEGLTGTTKLWAPPEDFPTMAARGLDEAEAVTLSETALHRMLHLCQHCISAEETRYYLNGVFLAAHPENGTLRAVATDGHRIAIIDDDTRRPDSWPGMIIPRKTVAILLAMTNPKGNAEVRIQATERYLRVHRDGWTVTSKLIDGTFPEYSRVIPKDEMTNQATLNHAGITRLDRNFRAMAGAGLLRAAKIDPATQQITMRSPECEATAFVMAEGDTPTAFNAAYLAEQTRVTPTIRIRWADGSAPALIESLDDLEHPERGAFWLLMPMRV